ncbi:2,3-diaminopropionate biosynthesis protein SbnB [Chitinophaga solisilvae]|uniref:2,3-diaminopropionate biosynthesis protein SbnB n=1 Tax=Chitinophaga solisilvae TaxID=1233460 RepID=A0A3S1B2L2_9BACT|nr:2,3-diaminopropionate biosynthesis protein SbnB [Chitinophaga solisilvae]NSL91007.1 2,3-diaminopropionate biosynthesis protein SbnB [Chitinophaga solisilvae]
MLYLNENDINQIGINWKEIIAVIHNACNTMAKEDFAQPVKPYLRYRNRKNRIIAMPGFLGGETELAGIKWIASFPDNLEKGIRRAHSVTILNDAGTGQPLSIINTPLISGIRTAAVSGLMLQLWLQQHGREPVKVGITGMGPIGRLHAGMLQTLLGEHLEVLKVYDIRPCGTVVNELPHPDKVHICYSWQEAFADADVFITCTVSDEPYINLPPKPCSLHLNVSLRDYDASWIRYADMIIVDDWEEVCRENTDIERMHLHYGLQQEHVYNIVSLAGGSYADLLKNAGAIMFNPMGMSVFDIAVAGHFVNEAKQNAVGTILD